MFDEFVQLPLERGYILQLIVPVESDLPFPSCGAAIFVQRRIFWGLRVTFNQLSRVNRDLRLSINFEPWFASVARPVLWQTLRHIASVHFFGRSFNGISGCGHDYEVNWIISGPNINTKLQRLAKIQKDKLKINTAHNFNVVACGKRRAPIERDAAVSQRRATERASGNHFRVSETGRSASLFDWTILNQVDHSDESSSWHPFSIWAESPP